MSEEIYLVVCENGAYSDYISWIAGAYTERSLAEAHVERGRQEYDAHIEHLRRWRERQWEIIRELDASQGHDVSHGSVAARQCDEELGSVDYKPDSHSVVVVPLNQAGRFWSER